MGPLIPHLTQLRLFPRTAKLPSSYGLHQAHGSMVVYGVHNLVPQNVVVDSVSRTFHKSDSAATRPQA